MVRKKVVRVSLVEWSVDFFLFFFKVSFSRFQNCIQGCNIFLNSCFRTVVIFIFEDCDFLKRLIMFCIVMII